MSGNEAPVLASERIPGSKLKAVHTAIDRHWNPPTLAELTQQRVLSFFCGFKAAPGTPLRTA